MVQGLSMVTADIHLSKVCVRMEAWQGVFARQERLVEVGLGEKLGQPAQTKTQNHTSFSGCAFAVLDMGRGNLP